MKKEKTNKKSKKNKILNRIKERNKNIIKNLHPLKLLVSSLILLLIVLLISVVFIQKNSYKNLYNEKVNMLIEKYDLLNKDTCGVAVSISNKKKQAITFNSMNDNIEESFKDINKQVTKYISNRNFKPEWIKINLLSDKTETTNILLLHDISNSMTNKFKYAVELSKDDESVLVLAEEINANALFDSNDNSELIPGERITNFLKTKNINYEYKETLTQIYTYTEDGYFINDKKEMYRTENTSLTFNRRTDYEDRLELSKEVVKRATNYLTNLIRKDGTFDYQYDMTTGEKILTYNIIRHAGSLWSIVKNYNVIDNNKSNKVLESIDKCVEYEVKFVFWIKNIAVCISSNKVNLGAMALTTCSLLDYYNNVDDFDETLLLARKICDGMLSLQDENGSIPHMLSQDLEIIKEHSTDYYDGEACLALLKLYDITHEEKYLNTALKLVDEFFNNSDDNYYNHWLSYCLLYLAENNIDISTKSINKAIVQLNYTADKYVQKNSSSHVALEYFSNYLNFYYTMVDNGKEYLVKNIDVDLLIAAINAIYENNLNTFQFEENAMYFIDPVRALDSFIMIGDHRLRVDDIQHSILGYNDYIDLYEKYHERFE